MIYGGNFSSLSLIIYFERGVKISATNLYLCADLKKGDF